MTLTITTNMASLTAQHSLSNATNSLNKSMERMTTGYKINSAGDDAAGYAVATKFDTKLGATEVAQDNVAMGESLLSTAESTYEVMITHFQRIRDLTEQAANGTYASDSIKAIKAEVTARLDEIDRISKITDYNGIKLMDGSVSATGINLQVGIDSSTNSQLTLEQSLFAAANSSALMGVTKTAFEGYFVAGGTNYGTALDAVDKALDDITERQTKIGANQNRLESAGQALTVQYDNITSSLSTVKDTDVAEESSKYVSAQILQQASATLLATANQAPSIALQLI